MRIKPFPTLADLALAVTSLRAQQPISRETIRKAVVTVHALDAGRPPS